MKAITSGDWENDAEGFPITGLFVSPTTPPYLFLPSPSRIWDKSRDNSIHSSYALSNGGSAAQRAKISNVIIPIRMTLEEFSHQLATIVPPKGVRPFVCDGSPLGCTAFIVGLNPATPGEFWPYWSSTSGFDKGRWFEDYKEERRRRRQVSGKNTPEVSPTRRIIERVVKAADPVRCLETNLYAVPTASISELAESDRSTAPIEFLLRAIKPKVLLLHGGGVAGLAKIGILNGLIENEFCSVSTRFGEMTLCSVRHFSRGWSYPAADDLGYRLRNVVLNVSRSGSK